METSSSSPVCIKISGSAEGNWTANSINEEDTKETKQGWNKDAYGKKSDENAMFGEEGDSDSRGMDELHAAEKDARKTRSVNNDDDHCGDDADIDMDQYVSMDGNKWQEQDYQKRLFHRVDGFEEVHWNTLLRRARRFTPAQALSDMQSVPLPKARLRRFIRMDMVNGQQHKSVMGEVQCLVAKACEFFISDLSHRAYICAEEDRRKCLQRCDVARGISLSDMFDFLIDIVPREYMHIKCKRGTNRSRIWQALATLEAGDPGEDINQTGTQGARGDTEEWTERVLSSASGACQSSTFSLPSPPTPPSLPSLRSQEATPPPLPLCLPPSSTPSSSLTLASTRRRGRPKGSKNKPKPAQPHSQYTASSLGQRPEVGVDAAQGQPGEGNLRRTRRGREREEEKAGDGRERDASAVCLLSRLGYSSLPAALSSSSRATSAHPPQGMPLVPSKVGREEGNQAGGERVEREEGNSSARLSHGWTQQKLGNAFAQDQQCCSYTRTMKEQPRRWLGLEFSHVKKGKSEKKEEEEREEDEDDGMENTVARRAEHMAQSESEDDEELIHALPGFAGLGAEDSCPPQGGRACAPFSSSPPPADLNLYPTCVYDTMGNSIPSSFQPCSPTSLDFPPADAAGVLYQTCPYPVHSP